MGEIKTARCLVYVNSEHHQVWCGAFKKGLERHGIRTEMVTGPEFNGLKPADLLVVWSAKWEQPIARQIVDHGYRSVCILERGYLGDRQAWTSVQFGNSINGEGIFFNRSGWPGERFQENFGHLLDTWTFRTGSKDGYALICGQVPNDWTIKGYAIQGWYNNAAAAFREVGYDVFFRPHPERKHTSMRDAPSRPHGEPLSAALDGAALTYSINSNSAVESILAGVPAIATNKKSIAWPVTGRFGVNKVWGFTIERPPREKWLERLAWKQWRKHELESGECWEQVNPEGAEFEPGDAVTGIPAIILGGAEGWQEELAQLQAAPAWRSALVIAANDSGADYPGHLEAWVSFHPEELANWRRERQANGYPPARRHVVHLSRAPFAILNGMETADATWPTRNPGIYERCPVSGIFGAKLAMDMGCGPVALCGTPLDERPHYRRPGQRWEAYERSRKILEPVIDRLRAHPVTSMSGWTAVQLGAPSLVEVEVIAC